MTREESQAVLAIGLMAAFTDGDNDDRERAELRRIAATLTEGDASFAALYQDVLLGRATLEGCASALGSTPLRQYAFEMAVCVCDADGARSPKETAFLENLRGALGLSAATTEAFAAQADAIAATPVTAASALEPVPAASDTELGRMILNYAILNGALELLPQNLATVAIIPLQMKMVYRIGKAHGFELDRGHVRDFLATAGVGLTSQYLEQFGRKLLGGLLGQVAGGLGRGAGSAVAGGAFSFATTYALGEVARRYYAGGRKLDTASLKQAFAGLLERGREMQQAYLPQIRDKAQTLDIGQVIAAARQ